ncbi:MAG: phosphodiester glycosidase family protein [Acholeplasmataceae bacterium]
MIRRILSLLLLCGLSIALFNVSTEAFFRIFWDSRDTAFYDGVKHVRIAGTIDFNGTESPQVINYLGANPKERDDLHVISADNYSDYDWNMSGLPAIIGNVESRYDHYEVIGGVNGDFYNMSTGHPVNAYIRDYEVLTPGMAPTRPVVGFKDDGTVVAGVPCTMGHQLVVYNEDGAYKHAVPVERFNEIPTDGGIGVFFPNHEGTVTTGMNKVVLEASDIKLDGHDVRYFGKGTMIEETTDEVDVPQHGFVVTGTDFNDDDLITETDYAVVQQRMGCGFEDVRFAIGVWEHLVEDGIPTTSLSEGAGPSIRHPRTAIGIEEDGTVFFVTVDGRQKPLGMQGVTAYEMAEIMAYFGAEEAYNLDGGGSSTMAIVEEDGIAIKNSPSDGSVRRVSNGLLFVKGHHRVIPPPVPFPDLRTPLETPQHVRIESGRLTFDAVANAPGYDLMINGIPTAIEDNLYALDLPVGTHEIKVRAAGDDTYRPSVYTPSLTYVVYPEDINDFIEFFKAVSKSRKDD